MVNFTKKKSSKKIRSPPVAVATAKPSLQQPGEIHIDIPSEQAKKLISAYNLLIKKELAKLNDVLFNLNSRILNLNTDDKLPEQKIEMSKLILNIIASLSSLQVEYRDENQSPTNN